jgi:hypothetical protein
VNPWLGALVVLLTLAFSTGGGWLTTRLVLRLASRSPDAGGTTSPARPRGDASAATAGTPVGRAAPDEGAHEVSEDTAGAGPEGAVAVAALRGGAWIGLLERAATTGALLYGEPTAITVVVAVKGLGRYPELREYPAASERFVIGSLASLTWAATLGFLGRWLLTR